MHRFLKAFVAAFLFCVMAAAAQAQPARVLWWDGSPSYPNASNARDREKMAQHLNDYDGGGKFDVTFVHSTRGGDLANHMQGNSYDILVFDVTTTQAGYSPTDVDAIRAFYSNGKRALMLDGTLWIRSTRVNPPTTFPGPNGAAAALLVNQMTAMSAAGGGIVIGTDHVEYQAAANQILRALVPGAAFSGRTDPSRDGDFLGDTLLGSAVQVRPIDILRHWEAIPSQAQAPVGPFQDFMGNPVTLYSLVETSDKPGGRAKRPYISASFTPGEARTAIDSEEAPEIEQDNLPTRKSVID